MDLINFILVNLLSILLILLPFFLIYKGLLLNSHRTKKAKQIFQEISLCRNCIIRNYKIDAEQTITPNQKDPYDDSPSTDTITKNFKIICKNCNSIIFNQSFDCSTRMNIRNPLDVSQFNFNQRYYEDELIKELKNTHFSNQGCSQDLYLISGVILLVTVIIGVLIAFSPLA